MLDYESGVQRRCFIVSEMTATQQASQLQAARQFAIESARLVAGTIVTTGSCTGAPLLPGPGEYRAEFATLGSVAFRFTA